jgi:Tol biopolymer transport system component
MINDQLSHSPTAAYVGITELAWSPTEADLLAVRAYDGLYVTNKDGSDVSELVSSLPSTGSRPAMDWSPDGSQIVFIATVNGNQEIMLSALDHHGAIQLTSTETDESQPVWRP